MIYEFTNDYLTGISSIDEQHKQFFAYINEGVKALDLPDDEGIIIAKNLIKKLADYADKHFSDEEAYMRHIKDVGYLPQLKYHQDFKDKVSGFMARKDLGKKDIGDIFAFMANWLRSHILEVDLKIGKETGETIFTMGQEFLTGIEIVDEEHKKLFEIISRAYDVLEDEFLIDKYDGIINVLNELKDYTILHFSDEEAYMERIGYDGLAAQKKVHEAFIEKITNLDLEDMDAMDDDQTGFLNGLMEFLTEWLVQHILKMDKLIPVVEE